MKLGKVALRFVVLYLKMGQLTCLCVFSSQLQLQKYKHGVHRVTLTRIVILTNEFNKGRKM